MTQAEVMHWHGWFCCTETLVKDFIRDIDERDHDFKRGLDRGWIRGLIAGMARMINSVDLPDEMRRGCEQTVEELTDAYEQITGIK